MDVGTVLCKMDNTAKGINNHQYNFEYGNGHRGGWG